NVSTYDAAGGQVVFTVSMTYPANVSAAGFAAKPSAATWTYVSTGGTNVPSLKPSVGDTTDPSSPVSEFGWTYADDAGPPANAATFPFTLSYPAALTGNQVFTFSGHTRLNGVLTQITIPSITLTSTPIAPAITTQPANLTVAAGASATFTVAATGTPTPTYKW